MMAMCQQMHTVSVRNAAHQVGVSGTFVSTITVGLIFQQAALRYHYDFFPVPPVAVVKEE